MKLAEIVNDDEAKDIFFFQKSRTLWNFGLIKLKTKEIHSILLHFSEFQSFAKLQKIRPSNLNYRKIQSSVYLLDWKTFLRSFSVAAHLLDPQFWNILFVSWETWSETRIPRAEFDNQFFLHFFVSFRRRSHSYATRYSFVRQPGDPSRGVASLLREPLDPTSRRRRFVASTSLISPWRSLLFCIFFPLDEENCLKQNPKGGLPKKKNKEKRKEHLISVSHNETP